jgi:hypothetical protein
MNVNTSDCYLSMFELTHVSTMISSRKRIDVHIDRAFCVCVCVCVPRRAIHDSYYDYHRSLLFAFVRQVI